MNSEISPDQIRIFKEATTDVMKLRLEEQEICSYWGIIFSPKGVATLTKQDITGFLRYEQNRRWKEISKEDVSSDMDRLRKALSILIDPSLPIVGRLNVLETGRGEYAIPYLGKAKLTPILLVASPKEYGVWNDYSERALRRMGLFPEFEPDWHLGEQYLAVNTVLVGLATEYKLSLWWLDIILERIALRIR